MNSLIKDFLTKDMGPLRCLLHLAALALTCLMPLASLPGHAGNWDLVFSAIVPATAPLVVIVIALDMMMCQVWKAEAPPARRAALTRINWAHLAVGGLLLGAWLLVFLPALMPPRP